MKSYLPPLRALQAFEAFGRLGSVGSAAQELGVTSGAISQQLKVLEDHLGMQIVLKDGRRAALMRPAQTYFDMVTAGFDKLRAAQAVLARARSGPDLKVSGLPTLLLKWLNPQLHRFQSVSQGSPIRLEATHLEPEATMQGEMFRLTYGSVAQRFPHFRAIFTDLCFPVCAPDFLERYPEAKHPEGLVNLPQIDIDWGPAYVSVPRWRHWFAQYGIENVRARPIAVHSLSSSALEAAAAGQGVALAQRSFAAADLELGRLVRLSEDSLLMPEPYYVCWGEGVLDHPNARAFLNWLLAIARPLQE